MLDVYNRTVFTRDSIQSIPSDFVDNTANTLYKFLGSFWGSIHEGRGLVKGAQQARGLVLAQFYLDLLETLKLQDRKGLPIFHRELWKPLIIRKSKKNTSSANVVRIGDVSIGAQPSGSNFGEGTVLKIGSLAGLEGYVTYPIEEKIETIASGITDNIIKPTVSYKVGTSFPDTTVDVIYQDGALIFPIDKDPFGENSPFKPYDVGEVNESLGECDQEVVLWASDVLIDKNYLAEHMAYALGIDCNSSEVIKRILNASWDAINCGLTPELFRTLIAALANIPVIQEEKEVVHTITALADNRHQITTDKHTYITHAGAILRDCLTPGRVLHRGDLLDKSIKIYPLLTNPSTDKLAGTTEYADILQQDVPVISIPKTLLRTRTSHGIAVSWTPTEVLWDGDLDANNHRKLYFQLTGSEESTTAFWEDVWKHAEEANIDLDTLFENSESPETPEGEEGWYISPAKFFLQHLIGANTLIVTLDRSQLEETPLLQETVFFDLLNKVIPSSMRLFFIEHTAVGDEGDTYDTDSDLVEEETDEYASEELDDEYDYNDLPGMRGKRVPTYEEQVEMKFFRNRKRSAS